MSKGTEKNPLSGLSHKNLPKFILHGFTAEQQSADVRAKPAAGKLQELIKQLPPLYSEPTLERQTDGTYATRTRTNVPYVDATYRAGIDVSDDKHYATSDLDATLDLSKFMVSCQWETMTTAPYANATAEFRLPAQLVHYLFHGEPASGHIPAAVKAKTKGLSSMATGFRFIEAGGWASIRFPYVYQTEGENETISSVESYRSVFFGKILSININTFVDDTSIFNSIVRITVGSFIQPLTTAETRKTPFRVGGIQEIDNAAIGSYDAKQNIILKSLVKQIREMRAEEGGVDMYRSLSNMIKSLGYMDLPTDLAGTNPLMPGMPHRLGDNVYIMGEHQDTTMNTIYELNAADINTIRGRPEERYFVSAFKSNAMTVWGLIQSLYQPSNDLIELFPVIIPLPPSENALMRGSGGGGKHIPVDRSTGKALPLSQGGTISTTEGKIKLANGKEEYGSRWENTPLVNNLKAVLYLMYRYKPMPPTFYGDKMSVDGNNGRKMGLNPKVVGTETHHSRFFGTHERYSEVTGLDGTKRMEANTWNPEFVYVNEAQVINIDLTWDELKRVNAVNMSLPFAAGQTGEANLFGVECVPVFNQRDINRHGLRMMNLATPFASDATAEHIRKFNDEASSGMAERLYYLVGEGHAYGSGQIVMVYTPNPDLTAGIWCQTYFMKDKGGGAVTDFVVGSGSRNESQSRPLTYYVTAVRHQVSVNPTDGKTEGFTMLTVERASYGNRIPAVAVNQVKKQTPTPPPKDTKRKRRRKPRRRRRR